CIDHHRGHPEWCPPSLKDRLYSCSSARESYAQAGRNLAQGSARFKLTRRHDGVTHVPHMPRCARGPRIAPGVPPVFACTLFDYNGVLVDDEHVHLAAFQDALAPLGISLSEADYWDKYLGFDDVGAFEA